MPFNSKISMPLNQKKQLQKLLKDAYVEHNVLNNKLVKAIASVGSQKRINLHSHTEIPLYPCLQDKEAKYTAKRTKLAKNISDTATLLKRVLNLRNSAIAKSLSGKQSTNVSHRFVNKNINGPELGHFNGLTPDLARNALKNKQNILNEIESESFLANQVKKINESIMGNEANNILCNEENNSTTTNSIKYNNLKEVLNHRPASYTRPTTASSIRANYGRSKASRLSRYGGKKKSTKKKSTKKKSIKNSVKK